MSVVFSALQSPGFLPIDNLTVDLFYLPSICHDGRRKAPIDTDSKTSQDGNDADRTWWQHGKLPAHQWENNIVNFSTQTRLKMPATPEIQLRARNSAIFARSSHLHARNCRLCFFHDDDNPTRSPNANKTIESWVTHDCPWTFSENFWTWLHVPLSISPFQNSLQKRDHRHSPQLKIFYLFARSTENNQIVWKNLCVNVFRVSVLPIPFCYLQRIQRFGVYVQIIFIPGARLTVNTRRHT